MLSLAGNPLAVSLRPCGNRAVILHRRVFREQGIHGLLRVSIACRQRAPHVIFTATAQAVARQLCVWQRKH
jgi:hypothetical protein